MAEFEEKLGAILKDPQAMGQIMALARSLGGGTGETDAPKEPEEGAQIREDPSPSGPDLDSKLMEAGMRAISAYQAQDDSKAQLLQALRPFVKEERRKKVDKAVRITGISRAIRAVLDGFLGGETHV